MINTIIDIFHQNHIDFDRARADGIVAIIHKATEGTNFRDNEYRERKQRAKDMGFLWGAYHFSSAGNVLDQVEHFLTVAEPDESDLVALDFEPKLIAAQRILRIRRVLIPSPRIERIVLEEVEG